VCVCVCVCVCVPGERMLAAMALGFKIQEGFVCFDLFCFV
jgi:hypothetical protein